MFDSSASHDDNSLSGLDLINSLVGVPMLFPYNPGVVIANIRQMFHSFLVDTKHNQFLRFFKNNDSNAEIVEYRVKVHILRNCPSPSVAAICLRLTAREVGTKYGSDVRKCIEMNLHVDDPYFK